MANNLTITKISDGVFDFTDERGNNFGGNNIEYWYDESQVYFKVNGETHTYLVTEISYDDGSSVTTFTSITEFSSALKTAGFTGNFNTGGATPQKKYIALLTQTGTDTPTSNIISDDIEDVTQSYVDIGVYQLKSLSGGFAGDIFYCPQNKGIFFDFNTEQDFKIKYVVRVDNNTIEIAIYNNTNENQDGFLTDFLIELYFK